MRRVADVVYDVPMSESPPTVLLNVRVPPEVRDRLDVLAERMGVDRTRAAHAVIAAGLDEGERVADYCERHVSGTLLLLGARAVGGREGYAKVQQAVRAARAWKREQRALPGLEGVVS